MTFLLATCQAANTFPLIEALAGYLAPRLQTDVRYEQDAPWQERSARIHSGEIRLGMICSRPYAEQIAASPRQLVGVAAPVTQGALYAGRPVYYAYLVVHRDHPAQSLLDMRGAVAAYNEPASQSGYFSLHWALARIGASPDYFSRWVESGAHEQSIALLLERAAEVAAIDSTLWDYVLHLDAGRFSQLRVIETLGPFPAPPLVTHVSTAGEVRARLTRILTTMHREPDGQAVLQAGLLARFDPVSDAAYRQLL